MSFQKIIYHPSQVKGSSVLYNPGQIKDYHRFQNATSSTTVTTTKFSHFNDVCHQIYLQKTLHSSSYRQMRKRLLQFDLTQILEGHLQEVFKSFHHPPIFMLQHPKSARTVQFILIGLTTNLLGQIQMITMKVGLVVHQTLRKLRRRKKSMMLKIRRRNVGIEKNGRKRVKSNSECF